MRKRFAWPGVVVVAMTVFACHTITEELPQDPSPVNPSNTPTPNPTAPVIVVPVPTVTLPAAPTVPAPSNPAPTNPTNPTNPAPSGGSCPLPPGQFNDHCTRQTQTFLSRVEAAIDQVIATNPGYFNMSRTRGGCANCYQVVDGTGYTNAVARAITRNWVCGYYDGEELAVKNSNAFNDQFDILTSDGFIRRQGGSYRTTCRPAWF